MLSFNPKFAGAKFTIENLEPVVEAYGPAITSVNDLTGAILGL
jgi:hypothetical protein